MNRPKNIPMLLILTVLASSCGGGGGGGGGAGGGGGGGGGEIPTSGSDANAANRLTDVTSIAAGGSFNCALQTDGTSTLVKCWGQNVYNQSGRADTSTNSPTPNTVQAQTVGPFPTELRGATAVTAGLNHACALLTNGKVYCWGRNDSGQIGNGSQTGVSVHPSVLVKTSANTDLAGVVGITAGANHTCAVVGAARRLYCWGANSHHQQGDAAAAKIYYATAVVNTTTNANVDNVTTIAGGVTHTCVLLSSGQVQCVGSNAFGERGENNNSTTASGEFKTVVSAGPMNTFPALANMAQISTSGYTTCTQGTNGRTYCWGYNANMTLGDEGYTAAQATHARTVTYGQGPLPASTKISVGAQHACAYMTALAKTVCWGRNAYGTLGTSTTTIPGSSGQPISTLGPGTNAELTDVLQLALGADHSCALLTTGNVVCWGRTAYKQTGYQEADAAQVAHHERPYYVLKTGG